MKRGGMDRRTALIALATGGAVVHGQRVKADQGTALRLILDDVDVFIVHYRGRRIEIPTAEIVAALGAR